MFGQQHPTALFRIELRKPDGNPKLIAVVHACSAALTGAWHGADKIPLRPDAAAVREALPHCYRAAFDRDSGFWFTDDGNATCHLRAKPRVGSCFAGKVLGSIWATPMFPLLRPE